MNKFKYLYFKVIWLELGDFYSKYKRLINTILFFLLFYPLSFEFLYKSEQITLMMILWTIYLIAIGVRAQNNIYLLHFKIVGIPLLIYTLILPIKFYYDGYDKIIVDRFFVPSKMTVYYILTTSDGWGQYFTNVKSFGFSSLETVHKDCIENTGTFLYVDHDGLINCDENAPKIRTY